MVYPHPIIAPLQIQRITTPDVSRVEINEFDPLDDDIARAALEGQSLVVGG